MQTALQRAASALGRRALGKPKTLTPAQRRFRAAQIARARARRWPAKNRLS